ncbi:hypothetical protein LINPERHAP2_LOCUS15823 [Linum perenne]
MYSKALWPIRQP